MAADIFGFVLVTAPNGKRALLNLDMTAAIIEGDAGNSEAVSIAGVRTPLATAFDDFVTELLQPAAP